MVSLSCEPYKAMDAWLFLGIVMTSSDFKLKNKALKKDEVFNWFDKYESSPNKETYLLNQELKKGDGYALPRKYQKLMQLKHKLNHAFKS